MLSDPQSVTLATVAQSMPAISRDVNASTYQRSDGNLKFVVSHTFRPDRTRYSIRLDISKIAADPLASANNKVYSQSVYLVIDKPVVGFTNQEGADLALALTGWLTQANLIRVLGNET